MGEQKVSFVKNQEQMDQFVQHLIKDVKALEFMLENDWFEKGVSKIGAEQEMVLIDKHYKASCTAMETLEKLKKYKWVETELAKFNLECNMDPRFFKKDCLSKMEEEIRYYLETIQEKASEIGTEVLLTGILPTFRKSDLAMDNLTPKKRYRALMDATTSQLLGSSFELRLDGLDEILVKHDSPLLEACNTSFQVHLQIDPDKFVKMYNIALAITGPVMAIAANSPLLFGKRLWHETRIALFQQALDTRTTHDHMRDRSPRVTFGHDWLQSSILEIYKEDIVRFRVLLSSDVEEDALEQINKGKTPKLRALQVHNSTVYRWNRPCYGISDNGKPHLRIECRVLPAGPTVLDEMANTAFWLGLMVGMDLEIDDIREKMSFEDTRDNFAKAARFGIDTKFTWFDNTKISATDLILQKLLPIARKGLEHQKVNKADIDKYLGVIEGRANQHMTGARWQLLTYTQFLKQTNRDEAMTAVTCAMLENQRKTEPVHLWKLPNLKDLKKYRPMKMIVGDFMDTEIFSVQKEDLVTMAANIMQWKKLRQIPVDDKNGQLAGLLTWENMLAHFCKASIQGEAPISVKEIMIENPYTVEPTTNIIEALGIMKKGNFGCLPVTVQGELVGIISETEFLQISSRLLERLADEE